MPELHRGRLVEPELVHERHPLRIGVVLAEHRADRIAHIAEHRKRNDAHHQQYRDRLQETGEDEDDHGGSGSGRVRLGGSGASGAIASPLHSWINV